MDRGYPVRPRGGHTAPARTDTRSTGWPDAGVRFRFGGMVTLRKEAPSVLGFVAEAGGNGQPIDDPGYPALKSAALRRSTSGSGQHFPRDGGTEIGWSEELRKTTGNAELERY